MSVYQIMITPSRKPGPDGQPAYQYHRITWKGPASPAQINLNPGLYIQKHEESAGKSVDWDFKVSPREGTEMQFFLRQPKVDNPQNDNDYDYLTATRFVISVNNSVNNSDGQTNSEKLFHISTAQGNDTVVHDPSKGKPWGKEDVDVEREFENVVNTGCFESGNYEDTNWNSHRPYSTIRLKANGKSVPGKLNVPFTVDVVGYPVDDPEWDYEC